MICSNAERPGTGISESIIKCGTYLNEHVQFFSLCTESPGNCNSLPIAKSPLQNPLHPALQLVFSNNVGF